MVHRERKKPRSLTFYIFKKRKKKTLDFQLDLSEDYKKRSAKEKKDCSMEYSLKNIYINIPCGLMPCFYSSKIENKWY